MTYLLDTNVLSELCRPRPDRNVVRRWNRHELDLVTASVVVHELWHRVLRLPLSRRRRELEAFLLETVAAIPVLAYDDRAARWHAAERARLAREGRTPAFVDGQIAAVAAVNGATVVTANVGDFDVFGGLTVETWFERRP